MAKPIEGTMFNDLIGFWNGVSGANDTILGHEGLDIIFGLGGNDTIFGGDHDDTLFGEADNDVLIGGAGADELHGGPGTDEASYIDSWTGVTIVLATLALNGLVFPNGLGLMGTAQGDTFTSIENLTGSFHNDVLVGNNNANELTGLSGDDQLRGLGGADTLDGGFGTDTASYHGSAAGVTVSLLSGWAVGGDATGDDFISIENLTGSGHADTLTGDDNANVLEGLPGNDELKGWGGADTLWGGAHHDTLNGGAGADDMYGGLGDDTYYVDHAGNLLVLGDQITEASGEGFDTVRASVSWALAAGVSVERLETTNAAGLGAINLTGNSFSNHIIGNNGPNVLNGREGMDTLTGHGGQDSFRFDTALNAATNRDEITDFDVVLDTILLDDAVFSAFANGPLADARFVVGTAAADANDNIIYDSSTGAISYDSDGNGATAAVQFASVTAGLALTHLDFIVV